MFLFLIDLSLQYDVILVELEKYNGHIALT